jgi:VanZ family protein
MKAAITPKINLTLYSLLLVITPFLLLQNYLQDAIGKLSRLNFLIGHDRIPVFIIVAFIGMCAAIYFLVRNYSNRRLLGLVIVIFLLWLGYNTSDYYFNHHFYDIQNNWHYFAYAIYTWLAWQQFNNRRLSVERIVLNTFLMAFGISLMDELIQVFISGRVFDLSDVAKDLWGCIIGQIFIHFVLHDMKHLNFMNFWPSGIKNWTNSASWLLILELVFAWVFLNVSSILSDSIYSKQVFLISIAVFLFLAFIMKIAGSRIGRYIVLSSIAFLITYTTFCLVFSKPRVSMPSKNLVVYKGILVPYFDLMIYPNGMIRLVDKKKSFNMRDKQKIASLAPDILILATGSEEQGGKGFQDQLRVEMLYNHSKQKIYQVIKLPNKQAGRLYNRLAKQGKKVLMIIHNS